VCVWRFGVDLRKRGQPVKKAFSVSCKTSKDRISTLCTDIDIDTYVDVYHVCVCVEVRCRFEEASPAGEEGL